MVSCSFPCWPSQSEMCIRDRRTAAAALKIAVDLVDEGVLSEEEAVLKVEPKQLDSLLHPNFDTAALKAATVIAKGLPASPGAATGGIYFTADEAAEHGKNKEKVIPVSYTHLPCLPPDCCSETPCPARRADSFADRTTARSGANGFGKRQRTRANPQCWKCG